MTRWFRFFGEVLQDPKVQRLPGETFKAWVNLLCLASLHDGRLPSSDDTAFALRTTVRKTEALLERLHELTLLDRIEVEGEPARYAPHNWTKRQYKSDVTDPTAAQRQQAYRDRNRIRNATVTVTAARAEPEPEPDPDAEPKPETNSDAEEAIGRASAPADDWPDNYGDVFWEAYPKKKEKLAAMKKLKAIRKAGLVAFNDLMVAVRRYAAEVADRDPQYIKHPTAWLNKGCWTDESLAGDANGERRRDHSRRSSSTDFLAGLQSLAADTVADHASGRSSDEIPPGRIEIEG